MNLERRIENLERRIEELIQKYNNEIDLINRKNGNYSSFTDEECEEAKKSVQDQIDSLANIKKTLANKRDKISKLTKSDEVLAAKKELKEYVRTETQNLNKPLQGKVSNIVSTYIGQIDKRFHNKRYEHVTDKEEIDKLSEKEKKKNAKKANRWDRHEKKVKSRYEKDGLIRYVAPRALAIGLGVAAVFIAPGGSALIPLMFGTTGTAIFNGINFAFAANVLAKTGRTIYNKIKFGGPLLEQKKKVYKGKYLDNINCAFNDYDNAKANTLDLSISKSADISPKPASPASDEKDKIASNVDRIINNIGIHFEDEYSDNLDNLYDQALDPAVQEKIKKCGLEEKFSKMEETVRKGREANLNKKISRFNELVIKKQYDKATNNELVELEKMNNELMNTYSQMKKNDTGNEATQRIINELEQSIYRYLRTDIVKLKTNEIRKAIGNLESSTNSVYSAMWLKTLKSVLNSRVLKFNEDKAKLSKLLSDVRKILPSRNARYANEHSKNPNSVDISMELSGKLKEIRDIIAGDYGTDLIKTLNEDDKETFELFSSYLGTKLEKVDKEFASGAKVVFEPVDDMGEIFYVGKCSGQYNGKPFELELKFSNLEDITFENIFNEIKKVVPDYRIEDGIHYSVDTKIVKSGRKI